MKKGIRMLPDVRTDAKMRSDTPELQHQASGHR